MEKQRPKLLPCQSCGKQVPVKRIVIRENKVLCEKCYEKLYVPRKAIEK
ncbi:MAG: TraR/DksA C4-type zinc finger protein [Candidatus Bathyarchaeota archaeon]|nr:MAG: TraR/DksA C4-type zinc finger protein [Candidatus Bathyarchaeota archaeon]